MIFQNDDPNSVALPVTEYIVITDTGRILSEGAPDLEWLFRSLTERHIRAKRVLEYDEYQAEIAAIEGQEKLNYEHKQSIEKGVA